VTDLAVTAEGLTFRYGDRTACDQLTFEVAAGSVHGFVGPNGSGKSTLFKVLATAYPMQGGDVRVLGHDLRREVARIRPALGVVFQSPALDAKLTVNENLIHGGHLYGLRGGELRARVGEMLERAGLGDRGGDRVAELSGGLRRRVELAKGLLARPKLVLLDEPSTGLDPGARQDLWRFLRELDGVTVLFTTHLMEEAESADRVSILSGGKIVEAGAPGELVRAIGDQVLEIGCADPEQLRRQVSERMGVEAVVLDRVVRIEQADAHRLVPEVMDAFGGEIDRVTVSHPSLHDVYIRVTGHRFWGDGEEAAS